MKLIKIIFSLVTSFALSWPILFTPLSAMQPTAQTKNIEIINAWYGDDAKNAQATYATASKVVPKIKEALNKYGFIAIPKEMHSFYGFDPLPNVPKKTAIHIRYNGKEEHLRADEGKDFIFPANTDQSKAHQALQELKNLQSLPAQQKETIEQKQEQEQKVKRVWQLIGKTFYKRNKDEKSRQEATDHLIKTATAQDIEDLKSVGEVVHAAIAHGNFKLAHWLIDNNVHLNAKDDVPLLNVIFGSGYVTLDCDYLIKTAPERIEFTKYLIEKGQDVNKKDKDGNGALLALAKGIAKVDSDYSVCVTSESVDKLLGPLTLLFVNAGASPDQLLKTRNFLIEKRCIFQGGCGNNCPRCVVYGQFWKEKVDPLIQDKLPQAAKIYRPEVVREKINKE